MDAKIPASYKTHYIQDSNSLQISRALSSDGYMCVLKIIDFGGLLGLVLVPLWAFFSLLFLSFSLSFTCSGLKGLKGLKGPKGPEGPFFFVTMAIGTLSF